MSIEQFPVKEKLATDLDSQLAWLVREMGYSRDKTKGYEEKLIRLARDPHGSEGDRSIFGFMAGYWHRARLATRNIDIVGNQQTATVALQLYAKVVAGLSDKVSFALWLQSQKEGVEREPEWLLDTALMAIRERVSEVKDKYEDAHLLELSDKPFEANPMGQAILRLHESYSSNPNDIQSLYNIALDGAAAGVIMWQAYAKDLEGRGFSIVMPKPGITSGEIEVW